LSIPEQTGKDEECNGAVRRIVEVPALAGGFPAEAGTATIGVRFICQTDLVL
jgi:hypothetical protein